MGTLWLSSIMRLERVVGERKISWWSGTSRRSLLSFVSRKFGLAWLGIYLPGVNPAGRYRAYNGAPIESLFGVGHIER